MRGGNCRLWMGACAALVAAPLLGAEGEYRQIQRVFCTDVEKLEQARRAYPDAFSTGLIGTTYTGIAFGSPEVKDFTRYSAFVKTFQARGVEVQVGVSSSIGHQDGWTVPGEYPTMVGANGVRTKRIACPRSDAFKAHLRRTFAKYAALKPSVIWVDDDFRMLNHPPADYGCFCDDCVRRFGAEVGAAFDRKGLVEALLADGKVGGGFVREAWWAYNRKALSDLAGVIAEAVREVDDSVAIGFMGCNLRGLMYAPPDFKAWIDRARNRRGEVWFRHGSGAYTDENPYADGGIVMKNVEIARLCAATEGEGVVNLTEEVTCPYTRRAKSLRMTYLETALNIGMAGADGTTYDAVKPNLDEQLRPDAVVAEMHRRHPELNRMYGLIRGKRQIGVAAPELPIGKFRRGPVKKVGEMCPAGDENWRKLVFAGVPFTFRPQGAAARLPKDLSGDLLSRARSMAVKDEIDRLCGGRAPSRIDTAVRMGQSVWASPDGAERTVFLYNFDFDDAEDVRLTLDAPFAVEQLEGDGGWTPLGTGDRFDLPKIPAWSVRTLRLTKAAAGQSLKAKIAAGHRIVGEDVWYGHRRVKFDFNGRVAWVVEPSVRPLDGKPWTWTMQWAEAFVDRTGVPDLLRRGFHHATIELFDTRMDEKGIAAAAEFQRYLVDELGFAPRANLVGMSWGGFFSTRYAAAHPQNVAKIYLDAPLLNFERFDNAEPGRIGPWTKREGTSWSDDPRMPVNMAEQLARTGVPILLLYGGQDMVVEPASNCERFAARFTAAGGKIEVVKRGLFGHHPHGLDPDKTGKVVEFFGK